MRDQVLAYIREHGLMAAGDRVAVAVSGGADSTALLRLLLELRAELGIVLSVAHFNHRIRGADADADQQFAAALAQHYGLDFLHASAGVPAHAAAHKLGLETAARELRYAWFRRLLHEGTADKVATAHTADDQAETVLMRLVRGAGTKGLAGIHPVQAFDGDASRKAVVRPMLGVRRIAVEKYLRGIGQPWREDATNRDIGHLRNRVRHQLLPMLERDFNPGVVEVLTELAEIARAEEEFFSGKARATLLSAAAPDAPEDHLAINPAVLTTLPLALRRRVVRALAETAGVMLEFKHVEQLLHLASGSPGRECELPAGLVAKRTGRELWLARRSPTQQPPTAYEYGLNVPGEVCVKEIGSTIKVILRPTEPGGAGYNREQSLDPRALPATLTVRNWRPGDRFWPAHSKAPKKLKELLQDMRVEPSQRALWPVVVSGDALVWVRGLPPAAEFLAPDDARQVVVIEEVASGGAGAPPGAAERGTR